MVSTFTMGSLFAGIGGFDLGFERAGFTTKWQVEIDPFATKVLAKNFPHAQRFGDIRTVGAHNLEPVDVICGGFPCRVDRDLWQGEHNEDCPNAAQVALLAAQMEVQIGRVNVRDAIMHYQQRRAEKAEAENAALREGAKVTYRVEAMFQSAWCVIHESVDSLAGAKDVAGILRGNYEVRIVEETTIPRERILDATGGEG